MNMKRLFLLSVIALMMAHVAVANPDVVAAKFAAADSQIPQVDNYGFLNAPDGSTWTYTASFVKQYGLYKQVTLSVYNADKVLVGTIVDSLQINDENVTGINQAEINPLVTQKFFNNDNQYEVMLFLHGQTKNYEGKFFNHVFSINDGDTVTEPVTVVEGRQVYAQNIGEYNENYVMVFARDSAKSTSNYTLCFDVRRKAVYGDGVHHTFRVPYANTAALNDLQAIFMFKNDEQLNYVLQQYEKPYFDQSVSVYEDPVVTPDNSLVITYLNQTFDTLYTTKVPIVQDANAKLLYTFPSIGSLNGMQDIILNHDGNGTPAYIVTMEKYNLESDGSLSSYYLYDVSGEKKGTIAENVSGKMALSGVVGQEKQWLFLQDVDEGKFVFVDVPSCKKVLETSIYLEDGSIMSLNLDRVAVGDSYQYVVALLQGDVQEDGTIVQRIAWLDTKGKLQRYDAVNLGKYIEAAQVNIDASVLSPWLFNTDDAREYMVLVKRYNPEDTSDKETALLICNTKGETLFECGESEELGGEINMVYVLNGESNPMLVCVYGNGNALTLNYTPLPFNTPGLQGEGTAEKPYLLTAASDFTLISKAPNAYYEVANDIDFQGATFKTVHGAFTGRLDGKGHSLKNVLLNGGLFGEVKDSVIIKDIHFEKPVMVLTEHQKHPAGLLANTMQGGFTDDGDEIPALLSGITMDAPVIKAEGYAEYVGAILGYSALFLNIENCSVTDAMIYAPQASVGGLVGQLATSAHLHASAFTGEIVGGKLVGGITAEIGSGEPVYDCHTQANLMGTQTIGGIVGFSARSYIHHCYAEGSISLAADAKVGKVGGIVGEIETDATGLKTNIVLAHNLVGLDTIIVPEGEEIVAHRVAGFTSVNNYEYDWDNVDWSKPQEEWPRVYFPAEQYMDSNYVVSALAGLDASIELNDTTTEGATLAMEDVTAEWLAEQGFALGATVAEPWVLEKNVLYLFFEDVVIEDAVEDVVIGEDLRIENGVLKGNGVLKVYNMNGMLMLQANGEIHIGTLPQGVYVVTTEDNKAMKLMQ